MPAYVCWIGGGLVCLAILLVYAPLFIAGQASRSEEQMRADGKMPSSGK